VCKVALDSVVDRGSSTGLVTSGAGGVIGLQHQPVQRVYSGESGTACMSESVGLQCFGIMNDCADNESFGIVSMLDECFPPVNKDIRRDNVQQVANIDLQFDIEKFVADTDASMFFVNLCISDESSNFFS